MLTDYTAYADIRAALGVSDEDIADDTLALPLYEDSLTQDLEDLALTLPATYAATKALSAPTAIETRFLKACSLFATFSVAKQLTSALPLFAAKDVTDGKAAVGRFDNPYKDVIKSVNEQYDKQRTRLIAALGAIGTTGATATTQVYMSVVSPAYDPVTGT
mgnify:CR=1 FL=1